MNRQLVLSSSTNYLRLRHRLTLSQIVRLGWSEVSKEELLQEKVQALRVLRNIQDVLDQLLETGIFIVVLKGPALSQRIYQDPTFRLSKDLDILVPNSEDVIQLRKILLNQGWKPKDSYWVEEMPQQEWYMKLAMDTGLYDPKTNIELEIHWVLDQLIFDLDPRELRELIQENYELVDVLNRRVPVLSPELELIYLIGHGARHAWFRLKWLVDIIHYPMDLVNVEKFEALLKRFRMDHLLIHLDELLRIYAGKGWDLTPIKPQKTRLAAYCKKQIEGPEPLPDLSFKRFLNLIYHYTLFLKTPDRVLKMLVRTIGIRPQDISRVKLDAYWKYFFYRYYSLVKRKLIK
ncbi:MAG: nucleotidyltransferase family protein [Algoriphagus sp.]|uniref:nucleotidyltransferase family protein n=1 Tax=Algoriphagus sp. TaxID=1872435 RepID=UPI0017A84508|nr:nucleotidyltransferase family protein [Algoriphagus sp.]NVJ87804.1 nucleotidyltransferase family protein [Algoriphagus sp.]